MLGTEPGLSETRSDGRLGKPMRLNTLLGARLPLSNSEAGAVPSRPLVSARTPGERTHSRALRPALAPYVIGTLARFHSRFRSPPAFFPRSVSLLSPPRCILASVPSQLPFRADFDARAFVLCSPAAHGLAGRVRRPPLQRPAVSATWLIRRRQQGEAPAGRGARGCPSEPVREVASVPACGRGRPPRGRCPEHQPSRREGALSPLCSGGVLTPPCQALAKRGSAHCLGSPPPRSRSSEFLGVTLPANAGHSVSYSAAMSLIS